MGALSRSKGLRFEREIAQRFRAAGIPAERNLEEVRSGNRGDLVFPKDVPLTVQAKVGARPPIYPALQEAEAATPPGNFPVALIRRNGCGSKARDDLAVLRLDDFVELVGLLRAPGVWS